MRQEGSRKCWERDINKLKKSVLNDAIKDAKDTSSASNDITDTAASAAASAIDAIPKSDDIYVFGIGVAAVPAICVSVFLAITKNLVWSLLKNK